MQTRQTSAAAKPVALKAAFETFLAQTPDAPQLVFPGLHIFSQPDANDRNSRRNLDTDPNYSSLPPLISTLLSHLVSSERAWWHLHLILFSIVDHSSTARAALTNRLGSDRLINRDDFIQYLRQHPPVVVIKNLRDGNKMSWGLVAKGDEPGAQENEVYINLDLTRALIESPPPELSPEDAAIQQARHKLLWSASFIHECVHATTKFFFSHNVITPRILELLPDHSGSHGEAGSTFERALLGYSIEVLWVKDDLRGQMWHINIMVAMVNGYSHILSSLDIERVQRSFGKNRLFIPNVADLPLIPITVNHNSHVRYRGAGISLPMDMEEEGADADDEGRYLRVSMCPRGVGLGLNVTVR
ncbi:hypothetical protein DFH06DRAFT_1228758 [Mycena polygramma]|nr:hypothetical protein DFH06DRAFT_1228758 [Mycena polygramma]